MYFEQLLVLIPLSQAIDPVVLLSVDAVSTFLRDLLKVQGID